MEQGRKKKDGMDIMRENGTERGKG